MSASRWIGILLVFYVVFLVLTAPARLAAHFLPPDVQAAGYLGTLWAGRVDRVQAAGLTLGPVRWSLRPLHLLLGCVSARISAGLPDGRLRSQVAHCLSGTTEVQRLEGEIPAALLVQALGQRGVALGGRIRPEIDRLLVVDAWPVALEGRVRWKQARILAPVEMALGDLVATLGMRGARILVSLDDEAGPVDVSGELVLARDGSWRLKGTLAPRRSADAALRQALDLLGAPDAEGRYRFETGGFLPRR